jgi:hypothetical protein
MTVQLNKPRHSSVVPLYCANQSCSYYERNKDLDLDSQKLICLVTNVSLGSELVVVLRPFANEKSIIFEFLSEVMNQGLISKKSQTLPRRCIGPVGLGTPPAGSRVTANLSNDFPWGSEGIFSRVWGLSSTEKVPTGTGSSPAMAQSS